MAERGAGHFCRVCKRRLPNEVFSGKGHRQHVCKECARMSREEREKIEQADEIFGFLTQSNISRKNVSRLRTLAESRNARIAELASIVLEVSAVAPHRRRRLKVLARRRRDLLDRLEETGLVMAHE